MIFPYNHIRQPLILYFFRWIFLVKHQLFLVLNRLYCQSFRPQKRCALCWFLINISLYYGRFQTSSLYLRLLSTFIIIIVDFSSYYYYYLETFLSYIFFRFYFTILRVRIVQKSFKILLYYHTVFVIDFLTYQISSIL